MTMWSEALAVKPPQRYPIFCVWSGIVPACDNESQLPSAPHTEQGESFHCALEESTKTVANSYAWAELVHPLLHQRHQAIWRLGRISPAPFATSSSEDFPDFQLEGRRLQSLVTTPKWAIFHVDGKKALLE